MMNTIIEIILLALVLFGIAYEDKLVDFEEKHLKQLRSKLVGLGYAFLIWLEIAVDKLAWLVALIIIKTGNSEKWHSFEMKGKNG